MNKVLNQNKIGAESGSLITSTANSRLFTEFYDNISYNPVTALACINAYSISMKQLDQNRMGGEPTADESPNLVEFMYAADKCLYFFANGFECAIILKGHTSKKEEI